MSNAVIFVIVFVAYMAILVWGLVGWGSPTPRGIWSVCKGIAGIGRRLIRFIEEGI